MPVVLISNGMASLGPHDGTSSLTAKKLNEDGPRKRLTDVEEACEDIFPSEEMLGSIDRKSSSGSVLSAWSEGRRASQDGGNRRPSSGSAADLWEHARRLSEAGVRRMSDTSVILTEDTDSFIIGDHVWVGGTKPGQIAYIGDTQFAPGEWAGVVLDEPVGKNDGCVAGLRYFQCEPKRGVFSRLTRLTRTPLQTHDSGEVSPLPRPSNGTASGLSSPIRRAATPLVSPTGSTRDLLLKKSVSPVLATSVGSLMTSSQNTGGDLKLGERVIVMSSQGSKAGTLRYLGTTLFAAGDWCGVELDDPLGKNDGSVENKRYFECAPKFGLFAPAHKVSRSPSSRRVSAACSVHPGGMKRTGSRESISSMTSAASSVRGARVRLGITSLGKTPQRTGMRTPTTPVTAKSTVQV